MAYRHPSLLASNRHGASEIYTREEMSPGPAFHGSTGRYGSINHPHHAAHGLPLSEPRGSEYLFTNPPTGRERRALFKDDSKYDDAKRPRGGSPQHSMYGRARETTLEGLEAAANALNGTYTPREIVEPSQLKQKNTPEPDPAKQSATTGNTTSAVGSNGMWVVKYDNLRKFLDSGTSQAKHKITEAGSDMESCLA
ncbi:MAG: hypothetical protein Q9226_001967 [Calogaya cf. arnoldii]